MPNAKGRPATGAKVRMMEDEIARQEAKLRKLQNELKEKKRHDQERNTKSILTLLQTEQLDQIPSEKWKACLPSLKKLLAANDASTEMTDRGPGVKQDASEAV